MLRKSVAILAVFLSFIGTEVLALGLGRVSVESSLNQPLRVRIEVLQLGDSRLEDVNIQVASPEDFERFNIERISFLNNIRFSTEASPQGNFVILTTNQIVREPYLSFILETRWSNGRLLSEHTILLDLPVYEDEEIVADTAVRRPISTVLTPRSAPRTAEPAVTAPASSAPSVQPIIEPEIIAPNTQDLDGDAAETAESSAETIMSDQAEPSALSQNSADESDAQPPQDMLNEESAAAEEPVAEVEEAAEEAIEEVVEAEEVAEEVAEEPIEEAIEAEEPVEELVEEAETVVESAPESITTDSSDTLSDIALRVRPDDSVSIQQTMLAIQALNPDAFTDGNINRMRSGEILRVPSLSDIQAIGQREAVAEVSRQNQQTVDVQPLAAPSNTVPAQDQEVGGQLSVITADPDADSAAAGAGVADDADNAELDQRITELENQLALRAEEADRARIEKEELESRLAELDEQIAAAQEIIRLRDLQLAQLQQSLADAAAEAQQEAQQQAAAPIPTEVVTQPQSTGFVDSLLRTLTSNSMVLIGAVVLVILLLAGILVMRNKAKEPDQEDLDSIAEDEFKGVTDAKSTDQEEEKAETTTASEFHDYEEAELDSELDDIINVGGQSKTDASMTATDTVLDDEQDILSQADILIEHGQLEQADSLLADALLDNPGDLQLLLKKLEVTAAQKDLSAFEMQAEILHAENDPEIDSKVDLLRSTLAANTLLEQPKIDTDAETQRQKDETASFLDDLGIDLDSFEDDAFHLADDPVEESPRSKPIEVSLDDLPEESEPEAIDLMFDLGADSTASESDDDNDDDTAESIELEFEDESSDFASAPDNPNEDDVDVETLEFEDSAEPVAGGESKDPEDLEIDTLEFNVEAPVEESAAEPEAELDLETFSFDPPAVPETPEETISDADNAEDDDNVLDFDFDKSEIEAEPEMLQPADPEAFDFDLDGDSADTVVEKSANEKSEVEKSVDQSLDAEAVEDEISLDFGVPEVAADPVVNKQSAVIDDDFDFDLNELEIADDEVPVRDVVIELTDDDFLDLDDEPDDEEETLKPSAESNVAADDIEFDFDDDFEVSPPAANTVVESATEDGDDLEFLSDDDIVFESPDFEGDPESLSDEDETATKLELAYAYQKMGDAEGAREILREVISEGTDGQVKEARALVAALDKSSD